MSRSGRIDFGATAPAEKAKILLLLSDLIRDEVDDASLVEQVVFGTRDPDEISSILVDLAEQALGVPVVEPLFYRSSAGCVAGLAGANGEAVVVKAHQPRRTLEALQAIAQVQEELVGVHFPCPSPILHPLALGPSLGYVTFESYLADPGTRKIIPAMLGVSARGLARLASHTQRLTRIGSALPEPKAAAGSVYPLPHSPLFDFDATAQGAEWIDEIAIAALEVIHDDHSEPTVIHGDWSAANVRFSETELLAVYDWDSLMFAPLSRAVGVAAATWSAWGEPPEPAAPGAQEVGKYVQEFEAAWGGFREPQRRAAYAHALYCLAYTARCEHSVDPLGRCHIRARPLLQSEGKELLRH